MWGWGRGVVLDSSARAWLGGFPPRSVQPFRRPSSSLSAMIRWHACASSTGAGDTTIRFPSTVTDSLRSSWWGEGGGGRLVNDSPRRTDESIRWRRDGGSLLGGGGLEGWQIKGTGAHVSEGETGWWDKPCRKPCRANPSS